MGDKNVFVINPTGEYKEIAQIEYQEINSYSSKDIRDLLLKYGPMVIDIWGDSKNPQLAQISNQSNNLSIIQQQSFNNNVKVDHDVLLVGYGTNSNKQKYWILQNSWGKDWGYNGFFGIHDDDNRPPSQYFKHFAYVKKIYLKYVKTEKSVDKVNPVNLILGNLVENYEDDKIITETGSIPPPAGNDALNTFYSMLETVPVMKRSETSSSYDSNLCWANNNNPLRKSIVAPTKSQGACGSCWVFAAMGMIQSAISKNGGDLSSLSEQWVLNSIMNAIDDKLPGFPRSGCLGGNTDMFKITVNGYKSRDKSYGSFGTKDEQKCPYNCTSYYDGKKDCANENKCGQAVKQTVQQNDDSSNNNIPPFIKNAQKFWDDNRTAIIIGIVLFIILIVVFSYIK